MGRLGKHLQHLDEELIGGRVIRLGVRVARGWNLALGLVLLLAGVGVLVAEGARTKAYACLAYGAGGVVVGLLLTAGLQRRWSQEPGEPDRGNSPPGVRPRSGAAS